MSSEQHTLDEFADSTFPDDERESVDPEKIRHPVHPDVPILPEDEFGYPPVTDPEKVGHVRSPHLENPWALPTEAALGTHGPVDDEGLLQCSICGRTYDNGEQWHRYVTNLDGSPQGMLFAYAYHFGTGDAVYHTSCWRKSKSERRGQNSRTLGEFVE